MKYSVEIREEKRLRDKITQPMTDSAIICRFLLNHQLAFCGARRPPVRSSAAALRRSGHP